MTRKPLQLVPVKECGECTACCTVIAVAELGKENYKKCKHESLSCRCGHSSLEHGGHPGECKAKDCNCLEFRQGVAGCSIYSDRPPSCSGFNCLWLTDYIEGDERRRPDKLGLVFCIITSKPPEGLALPINKESIAVLGAWEVWPDAAEEPAAKYLLGKLAKTHQEVIVAYPKLENCDRPGAVCR